MRERERIVNEVKRPREAVASIISFGSIDDLVEELVARPPEGNLVRLDSCLKDVNGRGPGLRVRRASVLVSARRGDEVLVADMVHSYYRALHDEPLVERELRLAMDNDGTVARVIEEQLRERGFAVGRGAYALPERLVLYHALSERIVFQEGRAIPRHEADAAALAQPVPEPGGVGQ